ncbi:MAG TPA: hypothetical protein VMH27_20330 [Puia sp.]|nr:hypothetical protein [Puia sp.]
MRPLVVTRRLMPAMLLIGMVGVAQAQPAGGWPKSIITASGTVINLYEPQVLSYADGQVKSRSVISVQDDPDNDPVFGVVWTTAKVMRDAEGQNLEIKSVNVDKVRIPEDENRADNDFISAAMEVYYPWVVKSVPEASVQSSLALGQEEERISRDSTAPGPKVYVSTVPTALVLIDGPPRLEHNERWGVDAVVNSRNVIVRGKDSLYYLYYAMRWYVAVNATGPFGTQGVKVTRELRKINRDLLKAARKSDAPLDEIDMDVRRIIVSTEPAVLIQTDGTPQKTAMPRTSLYRIDNSDNAIFYDNNTAYYYAEAGNSWYRSHWLKDGADWQPIRKVDMPADILLSGSKTDGWAEATKQRMDQYVPQTSRVDRRVTTTVDYDGAPRFKPILGTHLEYATNTCGIVFRAHGQYYALDNGVWFIASSPLGIWRVSDDRPAGLELIPPLYRVYKAKFVYVYQTAAEYVVEGYLPGYDDIPADGCALTTSYDNDWTDQAWGYDLGCVFGWGGDWIYGYYRFDRLNRYYGYMVYSGKQPGWRHKEYGPWSRSKGGGANGGGVGGGNPGGGSGGGSGGWSNGGIRSGWSLRGLPHPPGGWNQRTGGTGRYLTTGYAWRGSEAGRRPGGSATGYGVGGSTAGRGVAGELMSGGNGGSGVASGYVLRGLPSAGNGARGYSGGNSTSRGGYSGSGPGSGSGSIFSGGSRGFSGGGGGSRGSTGGSSSRGSSGGGSVSRSGSGFSGGGGHTGGGSSGGGHTSGGSSGGGGGGGHSGGGAGAHH